MEKLNVAIADDNEKMVEVLGQIIEEDKDLELVGKAHNGDLLTEYARFQAFPLHRLSFPRGKMPSVFFPCLIPL